MQKQAVAHRASFVTIACMKPLSTMPSGRKVYFDPNGRAATHLADTPRLYTLVADLLSRQDFQDPVVFIDHDAGVNIGTTDLVDTTETDEIVYAKRLNRTNYTRFAKHRSPIPTTYFTIALKQDERGDYELASAWIGRTCPNFPDEPNATQDSKPFWSNHALVWGTQSIQPGTETTICPW